MKIRSTDLLVIQCVLDNKRQLIQLNFNKSGLHVLECKTRVPYSVEDDSLVPRTHCKPPPQTPTCDLMDIVPGHIHNERMNTRDSGSRPFDRGLSQDFFKTASTKPPMERLGETSEYSAFSL